MKERPILFSAPMVRAILDGRKTQTRRVVKPQFDDDATITIGEIGTSRGVAYVGNSQSGGLVTRVPCRYGQPGDLLWVRETWRTESDAYNDLSPSLLSGEETILYDADGDWSLNKTVGRGRPSIHMPRWASRITLKITDVRVEHLQSITFNDAKAEGVEYEKGYTDPRLAFLRLWESINGEDSWGLNPWVWVVEFERAQHNGSENTSDTANK